MAEYQRLFVTPDVATIYRLFESTIRRAEQVEALEARLGVRTAARAGATTREILRAYGAWQRGLQDIAKVTAADATKQIRARLAATAKRPDTGVKPHLRDLIKCRPSISGGLPTGAVGVADIAWLNRAVNPTGPQYGTYWMAQEYGSTSMVGREVYGFFFGTGYAGPPARPDPQYAGGGGPHPIFVSSRAGAALYRSVGFNDARGPGARGGIGSKMTIQHPIQPRHFIRDGANLAERDWRAAIRRNEQEALRQLAVVATGASARRRP